MAEELTDDTIVIEAPSFIAPYIYEKPPPTDINFNDVSGKSPPKFPEFPREKSTLFNLASINAANFKFSFLQYRAPREVFRCETEVVEVDGDSLRL